MLIIFHFWSSEEMVAMKTRTSKKIPIIFTWRQSRRRPDSDQALVLWNQVPVWIREADAVSVFKNTLKTFLFEKKRLIIKVNRHVLSYASTA